VHYREFCLSASLIPLMFQCIMTLQIIIIITNWYYDQGV
jgi:hypothetical protein